MNLSAVVATVGLGRSHPSREESKNLYLSSHATTLQSAGVSKETEATKQSLYLRKKDINNTCKKYIFETVFY